ncbi:hypothetical protein T552_00411 [Pneumocystis carinii B80]|uniref:Vacuolar ATPase assembly integral membrane protein VMA21 n=1 Tax=Pneumocystis carinii (strain B80) TaxID=1408658 RepID=A0A0W4ZQQ5_PNEC8|nr:hypothetical protein T552_00411 [Pneumocystis carinii B80]KTW30699.1 hypothetical protein T552_00411 [Pneumocystis carinii B80]
MSSAGIKMSSQDADQADNVVKKYVLFKFFLFSTAMIIVPISSYYLSLRYIFKENNTTYAAIVAVLMTNVVLVGYIILALIEEKDSQMREKGETLSKKHQ